MNGGESQYARVAAALDAELARAMSHPIVAVIDDLQRDAGASPFAVETFKAFQMRKNGEATLIGRYSKFEDALERATILSAHKSNFVIERTNGLTGAIEQCFYTVKKESKPTYVYHEFETRRMHDLYAVHLFNLQVTAGLRDPYLIKQDTK